MVLLVYFLVIIMDKDDDFIIRTCHWCGEELYKKDIVKLANARGYGYYIRCPKCNRENVIEEVED